jgi:hypothetical protein
MSLKPEELGPIPEETARVAHAAYPKGNVFMRMCHLSVKMVNLSDEVALVA